MSDGPSIQCHRITKPYFRTCSTCLSHSQAPLCLCTRRLVSVQPEGTFGRLRYSLGGDRPSQTTRLIVSLRRIYGGRLESRQTKDGISPLAPPSPEAQVHRLPPILRRGSSNTMPSCSKAPRGLFVLLRVIRIFTDSSISPGPSLRQCSSRYAIRAGRNLPDKEFRYLRTVIVTAAVHRGFGSGLLKALPLTFRHWAGVSPYTSPCGFAETCGFVNQSLEPFHCDPPALARQEAPLIPKLRGQIA